MTTQERLLFFYDHPFRGFGLSEKEAEAAQLVAQGNQQVDIVKILGISKQTLSIKLRSACGKIGVPGPKALPKWFHDKAREMLEV